MTCGSHEFCHKIKLHLRIIRFLENLNCVKRMVSILKSHEFLPNYLRTFKDWNFNNNSTYLVFRFYQQGIQMLKNDVMHYKIQYASYYMPDWERFNNFMRLYKSWINANKFEFGDKTVVIYLYFNVKHHSSMICNLSCCLSYRIF